MLLVRPDPADTNHLCPLQVSVSMSTFLIDLNQMAVALTGCTARSLVIVDEFGKGTTAHDGLALLASCISHLLERGPGECPFLLVATHYFELFHQQLIPPNRLLKYKVSGQPPETTRSPLLLAPLRVPGRVRTLTLRFSGTRCRPQVFWNKKRALKTNHWCFSTRLLMVPPPLLTLPARLDSKEFLQRLFSEETWSAFNSRRGTFPIPSVLVLWFP